MDRWRSNGWWFTAAAVIALLFLGVVDNAVLAFTIPALLIVVGLIALPRQRARGAVAAIVATCVALAVVLVVHRPR